MPWIEMPWWVLDLDAEMKRVLTLNDKPRKDSGYAH